MLLYSGFFALALGQFGDDLYGYSEEDIFGSGDSEILDLADEYDFLPSAFARSRPTSSAFGRQFPPGVSPMHFVNPATGVFDLEAFKVALVMAYRDQLLAAQPAQGIKI